MAECFFCGTDAKLTRAHLFHQDIRAALPNESTEVTLAASSIAGGLVQDLIYTGDVREMNVKKLCGPCNRLWMEPIERAVGPIIKALMGGHGAPPPKDLFRLAHWATIVGALATQTGPRFDVPVEHRRQIRFTRTGQPRDFGTHLILTLDTYPGTQFDFMRFETEPGSTDGGVSWFSALHAGPVVIISAEFRVNTMIARELHYSGFESYLGVEQPRLHSPRDPQRASTGPWAQVSHPLRGPGDVSKSRRPQRVLRRHRPRRLTGVNGHQDVDAPTTVRLRRDPCRYAIPARFELPGWRVRGVMPTAVDAPAPLLLLLHGGTGFEVAGGGYGSVRLVHRRAGPCSWCIR